MTTTEFSNEFDTLLNAYGNTVEIKNTLPIGLDEYEKSIYLTQAQEDIVISLYSGKNSYRETVESTEEMRAYLKDLVNFYTGEIINDKPLFSNGTRFKLKETPWFRLYEQVKRKTVPSCGNDTLIVVPTTYDEVFFTNRNPYRRANDTRVLRLDIAKDTVEVLSEFPIEGYTVVGLRQPKPIILVDLVDLSINNINVTTECELNSNLHRTILERAVQLALTRYTSGKPDKEENNKNNV